MGYRNLVVTGDSGSINGLGLTIYSDQAAQNCGSTVYFNNSGTTSTLNVSYNNNTIIGAGSGNGTLSGQTNTGCGVSNFTALTSGFANTSYGYQTMAHITGGARNAAFANAALGLLTTGNDNVAVGNGALAQSNGISSVAIGAGALNADAGLGTNIAIGFDAMSVTANSGGQNIAIGQTALNNVTSQFNIGIGYQCCKAITTSGLNVCVGANCLEVATTGTGNNTCIGHSCLYQLLTGSNNVCLGYETGGSYVGAETNNICIGYNVTGTAAESNIIHLGNSSHTTCYITGIDGVNVGSVAKVVTEASNQLGTATITGGTGVTVTATANTITISASSSGFSWNNVTGGSATLVAENGYFANAAGLTTFTLPSIISSSTGDTIKIIGLGAGGWVIAQLALEQIIVGSAATTAGIGGSVASTNQYDTITLVYSPTSGLWRAESWDGNLSIT